MESCPDLASMLDATPELIEATRRFVPHFHFALDNLAVLTPAMLSGRALEVVLGAALSAPRHARRLAHRMAA